MEYEKGAIIACDLIFSGFDGAPIWWSPLPPPISTLGTTTIQSVPKHSTTPPTTFTQTKDRKYLDDLKTAIKSSKDTHDALTDKQQSLQRQLVSGEWLD